MPVCSRCAGIYLGICLSLLIIILLERKIKGGLPSLKILLISVGVFFLMGADVVLSFLGLIQSSNVIRLITGFMTGWFLALLLFPLANNAMFKRFVKKNYLDNWKKFLAWLVVAVGGATLFIFTYQYIIIVWSIVSVLGLISFVSLILFNLFFSFNRWLLGSIDSWKKYVIAIITGAVSSGVLLLLFSFLRRFLI